MNKLFNLLCCSLLLIAGLAACSADYDDPPEQPDSHQDEVPVDSMRSFKPNNPDNSCQLTPSTTIGKWKLICQDGFDLERNNYQETLEFTDSLFFYKYIRSNGKDWKIRGCYSFVDKWMAYNDTLQRYEGFAYAINLGKEGEMKDSVLYRIYLGQNTDTLTMVPDYVLKNNVVSIISFWKTYSRINN